MPPVSTAGRRAQNRPPEGGVALRLFFAVGLMFQMPTFVSQLTYDPVSNQSTGSIVLQLANLLCFVIGAAVILTAPDKKEILRKSAAPLLLVGIALLSTLWSNDRASTFRACFVLASTTLFTCAMCARLSPAACVQLMIRMMTVACLLSVIWVILFPETGVHQSTDASQTQHAGLWRGVFSHKQGLGVVSGLTTGLLLSYGSVAFPSLVIRIGAMLIAFACVLGSQSVTGLLITFVLSTLFYLCYWIARGPAPQRRTGAWAIVVALVVFYLAFHFQLLNFIMPLLGKSEDLTGRADFWPWVLDNLRNTAPLLGGGYSGGLAEVVGPGVSIDNGFIEKIVDFGYGGSAVLLAIYARSLWGAVRLIMSARPEEAAIRAFPLVVMLIELFIGISETAFMSKSINWVVVIVAMYQVAHYQSRGVAPIRSAGGSRTGAHTARPASYRSPRGPAAHRRSADHGEMHGQGQPQQ
jgi:hypothetical protein